jgi:hypothetical protein
VLFKVTDPPIITVVARAFFDIGHSLKNQSTNRRSHLPGYAAWEIHPVMKIDRRKDPDPAQTRGIQPRSEFRY